MYRDRRQAGRALAHVLRGRDDRDVVILGLPRGGVPVAAEVARAIGAPLDVIVVRKIGAPLQPEFAIGAIGEGGVRVVNEDAMRGGASARDFAVVEAREREELERRAITYRDGRAPLPLTDRTAVIVDDGIATGSTAAAASRVARELGARRVVVAVPVASRAAVGALAVVADEVIAVDTPEPFFAVGEWYHDFSATTDAEVVDLLREAATPPA